MSLVIAILCLLASCFAFCAALGVFRFSDAISKLHAAGKAGGIATGILFLAVMICEPSFRNIFKCMFILSLYYLTSAQAAQLIARAYLQRHKM